LETNNASVKTRKASEEEPTTQPLGRHERWSEAGDPRSVSTIVLPIPSTRRARTRIALGGVSDRRRLQRDLHDAVQNELVALIVKLAVAQEDPDTSVALARTLAELEALAQTTLDSVRNIAQGVYPPQLADFGVREALRAQAARVSISVSLQGTAPRSTQQTEEAVYLSCSEAIQNTANGLGTALTISLPWPPAADGR
jgi:signal transduction histidine kinase